MQVVSDNGGAYRSITKAFRTVIANEGYRGLYQGMSPALFAASGSWGGYFFFYERSKKRKLAKLADGEKQTLGTPAIVSALTLLLFLKE
jgi:solute carrier family 25 folate transporter 32